MSRSFLQCCCQGSMDNGIYSHSFRLGPGLASLAFVLLLSPGLLEGRSGCVIGFAVGACEGTFDRPSVRPKFSSVRSIGRPAYRPSARASDLLSVRSSAPPSVRPLFC